MKLWSAALLATGAAAAAVARDPSAAAAGGFHAWHPAGHDASAHAEAALPPSHRRIPTSYESAVLARRVLALTHFGTISTVFPAEDDAAAAAADADADAKRAVHTWETRPAGLDGVPVGLPEYVAACEDGPHAGDPTLLAIRIATTFKNARAGSNVSLALQWEAPPPPPPPPAGRQPSVLQKWLGATADDDADADAEDGAAGGSSFPPSQAALPRFALIGYLEPIAAADAADAVDTAALAACFVDAHPDARFWLPGSRVHASEWLRLVVTQVYWVGGFGDRAYIGWIPIDEWRAVTRAEWEAARLPGEPGGSHSAGGLPGGAEL